MFPETPSFSEYWVKLIPSNLQTPPPAVPIHKCPLAS